MNDNTDNAESSYAQRSRNAIEQVLAIARNDYGLVPTFWQPGSAVVQFGSTHSLELRYSEVTYGFRAIIVRMGGSSAFMGEGVEDALKRLKRSLLDSAKGLSPDELEKLAQELRGAS